MIKIIFSKIQRGATAHWAVLVLCIAVSMAYGMHHLVLLRAAETRGAQYHPLVVNEDEAMFTAPKAHAAQMGKIVVGDFNVAEYKDTRLYVLPFLSPLIMGNMARLTGSIERAFIAGDFIFPPIIFLLFYILLLLLSERRLLSVVGATLFIFIPTLLLSVPPVIPYLQATLLSLAAKGSSLYFSRVEDPQLTMPLYLAALIFFLMIFKGRKERWITALAGIFYGLLFYSYFYYWMYVSLALPIAILLTWRWLPAVRARLIAAMALGLLISVPHWINASLVAGLPQYPDLFDRLRPEVGRALNLQMLPVFAYVLHAVLIAAVWFFMRKTQRANAVFLASFLLPIYAAYNIQLVTGFNVHPDHWFKAAMPIVNAAMLIVALHAYRKYGNRLTAAALIIPWIALSALLIFKIIRTEVTLVRSASLVLLAVSSLGMLWLSAIRRYAWLQSKYVFSFLAACAITLLFIKGVLIQRTFIGINAPKTLAAEEFASYEWLTKNTPAYSVIATPSFTTNARLQLYTQNRLFLPNGYNTIAGDAELWTRLRLTHSLFGTPADTYRAILEGTTDLGGGGEDNAPVDNLYFAFKPELDRLAVYYLFHMHYLDSSPGSTFQSTSPVVLPPEIRERELNAYEKRGAKSTASLPYRLDYLYYGPRERLLTPSASALSGFKKIYDSNGIAIYQYRHE